MYIDINIEQGSLTWMFRRCLVWFDLYVLWAPAEINIRDSESSDLEAAANGESAPVRTWHSEPNIRLKKGRDDAFLTDLATGYVTHVRPGM